MRRCHAILVVILLMASGCLLDRSGVSVTDAASAVDGGRSTDGGREDAGRDDAGPLDAAPLDAGPLDAGPPDACSPAPELCNGLDDDCDPRTDDGSGDPEVGAACDGDDADECEDDAWACGEGALRCADVGGDVGEVACNGTDDDCDGEIDEGASFCGGCERRSREGRSYLFCHDPVVRAEWFAAAAACQGSGYRLAIVEDVLENSWIAANAAEIDGVRSWWIGLSDHTTEDEFVWNATGAVATFTNWNDGGNPQPNDDIRPAIEDFVYLESNAQGTWFDNFQTEHRFVCEAGT